MQAHFYVAHHGEQLGPFSLEEIVERVHSKQLDLNDYLYDDEKQDWVVIGAYPAISDKMKHIKPSAPPPGNVSDISEHTSVHKTLDVQQAEWFVLKGDNKFGPFAYTDLVRMLQDKSVFEFDYVWHAGLGTWKRIAELSEFAPTEIRKLKSSSMPEINEVFFRRRHARANYGASIIVHNNHNVWKGKSIEVSPGGAGIIVENAMLQPGQTVYLHFKPGDGVPPFNAVCEVVSKKFVNVKDKNAAIQYGVKFTSINTKTQQAIQEFTSKKSAKKAA